MRVKNAAKQKCPSESVVLHLSHTTAVMRIVKYYVKNYHCLRRLNAFQRPQLD